MSLYTRVVRPGLFRTDPEWIHDRAIRAAAWAGRRPWARALLAGRGGGGDPRLATEVAGLRFANPVGLAAGFDKSGRAFPALAALGFGHVEIGSISADPSRGNPKPRLFRIPRDRGIVVYYGLPNDGAEAVGNRLAQLPRPVPLGINLVNTNRGAHAAAETDDAIIGDYLRSVHRLRAFADYFCLNLSCPNTRDGRGFFADSGRLRALLGGLDEAQLAQPVFLKIAPFGGPAEMDAFLGTVSATRRIAGFAVNLPPGKPAGLMTSAEQLARMPGAVSGRPCEAAINHTLAELYRRMDRNRYRLIAAGGVFSAEDAYRKIRLGASLVQLLTALVYEGPFVVRSINAGLGDLLARDGFKRVEDAVGVDAAATTRA